MKRNPSRYYAKKILIFLFSILVLSLAVFYISRLAPGDPLMSYYGERVEKMSMEEKEALREKLGLHAPIHVQYIRWLENAVQGDFGISYKYKQEVMEVIGQRLMVILVNVLQGRGELALLFPRDVALGIRLRQGQKNGVGIPYALHLHQGGSQAPLVFQFPKALQDPVAVLDGEGDRLLSRSLALKLDHTKMPRLGTDPFVGAAAGQEDQVIGVGQKPLSVGKIDRFSLVFDYDCPAEAISPLKLCVFEGE